MDDHLSRNGSAQLAKRLDDYWHARGWPEAKHWAEQQDRNPSHTMWVVRSNLQDGYPPK